MMLAAWLFPDESKAVVPAPSSKAQSAIGLVATCPSAVHPNPSRQTDAAPVRTRLAAPNVRVPIRGIGFYCTAECEAVPVPCGSHRDERYPRRGLMTGQR